MFTSLTVPLFFDFAEQYKSDYSFRDGFIHMEGRDTSRWLATVTANARRGQYKLNVSRGHGIKAGQWIRVAQSDPATGPAAGSLVRYLYSGMGGSASLTGFEEAINFPTRVTRVGADWVELERPLSHDLRQLWRPQIWTLSSSVQSSGIENLSIKFMYSKSRFTEKHSPAAT